MWKDFRTFAADFRIRHNNGKNPSTVEALRSKANVDG